jgi:hypothetical protein
MYFKKDPCLIKVAQGMSKNGHFKCGNERSDFFTTFEAVTAVAIKDAICWYMTPYLYYKFINFSERSDRSIFRV